MSAPPGYSYDPYETRQPELVGLTVALTVLTLSALSLRFAARKFCGAGFWWDDWMALIAAVFVLAINAFIFTEVANGYGLHSSDPLVEVEFLKLTYLDEILGYNVSLALVKISILLFFLRVFPTDAVRWMVFIMLGVVVAWEIATETALIFQCTPVPRAWNMTIPGHCIDNYAFFIGQAISNIVTDVLIMLLPLHSIWKLQMPLSQRIVICCIFCLGIFVVVCSIARLVSFVRLVFYDLTWTWVTPGLWTVAEPNVAFISACLPAFGPFFRAAISKVFPSTLGTPRPYKNDQTSYGGGTRHSVKPTSGLRRSVYGSSHSDEDDMGRFLRLEESLDESTKSYGNVKHQAVSKGMPRRHGSRGQVNEDGWDEDDSNVAMDEIHVRTEVQVTASENNV